MRDVLNYLEGFVILSETLSFSETAHAMNVTQPCVSRQIRLLEERLGLRLFVRDKHSVHLTDAGRDLKLRLSPLVKEIQSVLKEKRGHASRVEGVVTVGSLAEIGQSTVMPLLLAFRATHPGVSLDVHYLKEFEIVDALKKGDLSLGMVTSPVESENVRSYEVLSERVLAVTRAGNARDLADPGEADFVVYRQGDRLLQAWIKRFHPARAARKLRAVVAVNSHRSMMDALLASDAYAIMPEQSVSEALASGRLRAACPHEFRNPLLVAVQENALMESKNEALLRHLLDGFKKRAAPATTGRKDDDRSRKRPPRS